MHSKCKDEQFSQQVLDLVQTLVNFYNVHKKTHENQRSLFTTPKHMSFVPLSTRANHYRFKQYSSDSALDLSLRRAIDYRTGNRFVQQNYPTWLGSRGSLASSTYINSLLNALGYNEPEYVDPPESPNILEVTEEDNEAEKLLKDSPKRWDRVQSLITQSEGKPSVAPESDKRPALVITPTENDFENLEADDLAG